MKDLVGLLRFEDDPLSHEAAAEIERLTAERDTWKTAQLTVRNKEIEQLHSQLVCARKALERASPIISDRAAGGRMLTSKEEASEVFGLIQAALIRIDDDKPGNQNRPL